jgi:(1->4)-alpha-D-glucan 1-alpha-D-glucosylmutase
LWRHANAKAFEALYTRFIQHRVGFHDAVYEKKKLVMQVSMSSEINTLGHYLNRLSEQNRHTRDFTLNSLIKAIVEVIAFFPVYRTYINGFEVMERDRQYIESAVGRAKRKNPAISASVFDFVRDVLLLRFPETLVAEQRQAWLDFVLRFQQITGPVMAKGVEDTAFYLYNRLVSLNEVGGSPERFGITLEAFHGQNLKRCKQPPPGHAGHLDPRHQAQRRCAGPDQRAVGDPGPVAGGALPLEPPEPPLQRPSMDGKPAPSRNEEYLLYQTLVGTWPLCGTEEDEFERFRSRIREYMLKAMREAKVHTSWISPNSPHEDAVLRFIDLILDDSRHNAFSARFLLLPEPDRRLRHLQLPLPDPAQDHLARHPRFLPGERDVGLQPGGSRQPPSGGFQPEKGGAGRSGAQGG